MGDKPVLLLLTNRMAHTRFRAAVLHFIARGLLKRKSRLTGGICLVNVPLGMWILEGRFIGAASEGDRRRLYGSATSFALFSSHLQRLVRGDSGSRPSSCA